MTKNEIWKDINGYEGKYQVSNMGRIKSLNYKNTGKERLLVPFNSGKGYLAVNLYLGGQKKKFIVHRLVANAFIPNPDNLPQVNHLDEVKTNNCVDNLEWITAKDNSNYGTRNQRVAESCSKKCYQFTLDGEFVREWPSYIAVKREIGIENGNIGQCVNKKRKSAGGYIWRDTYEPA